MADRNTNQTSQIGMLYPNICCKQICCNKVTLQRSKIKLVLPLSRKSQKLIILSYPWSSKMSSDEHNRGRGKKPPSLLVSNQGFCQDFQDGGKRQLRFGATRQRSFSRTFNYNQCGSMLHNDVYFCWFKTVKTYSSQYTSIIILRRALVQWLPIFLFEQD